jgi:hypothetical protein
LGGGEQTVEVRTARCVVTVRATWHAGRILAPSGWPASGGNSLRIGITELL